MRAFLFLQFLLMLSVSQAQTTFWTESFSGGSAARGTLAHNYPSDMNGSWTMTNLGTQGSAANQWYVSGEECGTPAGLCGSACPNSNASLHISAIGGLCINPDCGAAYNATDSTNSTSRRIASPIIDCGNYQSVSLSFDYIAAQGDMPSDQAKVVYSCNGGSTWQDLPGGSPLAASACCLCSDPFLCLFTGLCCGGFGTCTGLDQGQWTNINIPLPACVNNNTQFRFGFVWQNDGDGLGTDPSFAVDDIELKYDFFLPEIELLLAGSIEHQRIHLRGEAAEWLPDYRFVLEKQSAVGARSSISSQAATSSSFEAVDFHPQHGLNVYKLSLLGQDGRELGNQWIEIFFEQRNQLSIQLAPQPLPEGKPLLVNFSMPVSEAFTYEIFDAQGQKIRNGIENPASPLSQTILSVNNLASGMYFLHLHSLKGDFFLAERFIIR